MIKFNELKVSELLKSLIIDVSVNTLGYYANVYISLIIIDTLDTYTPSGPSSTPIYTYTVAEADNLKYLRQELTEIALNHSLDNTLFFVYVVTKGIPTIDVPCGMDNVTTLKVTSNLAPIYRLAIKYLSDLGASCSIPLNLVNFIIRLNGLDLALKLLDYSTAIKYWNKYFTLTINDLILLPTTGCTNCL